MQGPRRLLLAVALVADVALAQAIGPNLVAEAWRPSHEPRFESVDAQRTQLDGPVRAVAEDADGLVWAVGGADLWRFDGYRLVKARLRAAGGGSSEESPVVQTVRADAGGALWVGAARGLFRVDRSWPSRPALVPVPLGGPPPSILFIDFPAADADGIRAYLGTVSAVLRWRGGADVETIPIPDAGPNRLHALHVDAKGRLWAGTTQGLYRLDASPAGTRWVEIPLPVARARIAALTSDREGRLWIGTASDGLYSIEGEAPARHWPWPTWPGPTPRIFALAEVGPGELWVGQFGHGVWALEVERGDWKRMRHDRARRGSLDDDNVWSVFADSRGVAWIGTSTGLQYGNPAQRRFLHLPLAAEAASPQTRIRAHGLAPSGQGAWMGTSSGRLRHVGPGGPPTGEASLPALWGQGDPAAGAMELITAMGNGDWVLGSDCRTMHVRPTDGRAEPLQPEQRGGATYTSAAVSWQGAWWLAGPDGLWRLPLGDDGRPKTAAAHNLLADTTGERRVSSLLATPGRLWLGTWSGLAFLEAGSDEVQRIAAPGLEAHFVTTMAADGLGRLWVGTSAGGLFHAPLDRAEDPDAWAALDEAGGLPGNSVAALVVDHGGSVWASTSRGLASIDPRRFVVRTYRADQGAAAAPYVRRSGTVLPGGELLFGGTDALTVVLPDPTGADRPPDLPPVVLTDVVSNEDEPALLYDAPAGIEGFARLRVPPGVSRLSLEFAAPVYLGASGLRYRYRLRGWDDRWSVVDDAHRVASFTRLAPGTYRFEAQVAEATGPWRRNGLGLDVVVIPAWHQHRGVHVAAGLALLTIIVAGVHWRARLLRARARELERMVDARTADLAAANAELEQAHRAVEEASLTDPLTGLHNRRFLWRHIDADVALALRGRFDGEGEGRDANDLVFFLVDVDHFKRINDQHGHAIGDVVLVEMGRRLRAVFRESDHVVRWGGEEFLGVARGAHRGDAPRVAERIRAGVAAQPFALPGGGALTVTCSVGYAALPLVPAQRRAFGWEDTVAIADEALYHAKAAGRDGWAGFEESGEPIDLQDLAALRLHTLQAVQVRGLVLRGSAMLDQPGAKKNGPG